MNINLELQKIIVNAVSNITYLRQHNIKMFVSVPDNAKIPYIKLCNLSMNKKQNIAKLQTFTIELFVATNGKNNDTILQIMDNLYTDISEQIEFYTSKTKLFQRVYNIYNLSYTLKEDLQNGGWGGNFCFDIDIN